MNPLWRITMDMSKSRSESQKLSKKRRDMLRDKTRKEKEKRRLEALERDRQRFIVGQEQNQDDLDKDEEPEEFHESAAEKFQKELYWCIQQTQVGLANLKPSSKEAKSQAEEAHKLLRILTSAKAPMAKKRQVMRATFGDYRTKMQQEERRHKAEMSKRMCLEPVSPSKQSSSTFFKKSASASTAPSAQILSTSNSLPGEAGSSGNDPSSSDLDLGSSRGTQVKGRKEDALMQDLIRGTEGMCMLNPGQNETGDENTCSSNANQSKESDVVADDTEELKQSHQEAVSQIKTEKPSRLALNLNADQPFLFNFDISERDLDRSDTCWRGSKKNITEGSFSENSTPEKGPSGGRKRSGSRKRNRSKKKQQAMIQDKDVKDAVVAKNQAVIADKEALVSQSADNQSLLIKSQDTTVTENQKLKLEADGEFRFNFPDPVQQPVNLA